MGWPTRCCGPSTCRRYPGFPTRIGRSSPSSSRMSGKTRRSWCCFFSPACSRCPRSRWRRRPWTALRNGTSSGGLCCRSMRPIIIIALMLRITDTFRTFDVVWLMTQGGPGGATNLITVNAYLLAFQAVDFRACGGGFLHRPFPLAPAPRECFTACHGCANGERVVSDHALQPPFVEVARRAKRRRRPVSIGLVVRYAALVGTILLTVFPLAWLVINVAAQLVRDSSPRRRTFSLEP